MNNLCKICDTRERLRMCNGRDGDFKYCFRRVGTTSGLKETITPFITLHELYEKCDWLEHIVPESLYLEDKAYVGDNMRLLWGQYENQIGTNKGQPVGYVIANTTEDMKPIEYSKERII